MNPAHDPNIKVLLDRLVPALNPRAVYLFGSRARGEAHPNSDYDLFLIVDDDTPREKLQPQAMYPILYETGLVTDLIPCRYKTYQEYQDECGSLSYVVKREGRQIYARDTA